MNNPEIKKNPGRFSEDDFYDVVKEFFSIKSVNNVAVSSVMNEQAHNKQKIKKIKFNLASLKESLLGDE